MLDYYTYKDENLSCKNCGWKGKGSKTNVGESFSAGFEINCPRCHESLGELILFPTHDEVMQFGSPEDRRSSMERKKFLEEFNASCLESIDQLPEIEGENLILHIAETEVNGKDYIQILHGSNLIWQELRLYEYYERFIELGTMLKHKYGNRLIDLVPPENGVYLYGDSISSIKKIEEFRKRLNPANDLSAKPVRKMMQQPTKSMAVVESLLSTQVESSATDGQQAIDFPALQRTAEAKPLPLDLELQLVLQQLGKAEILEALWLYRFTAVQLNTAGNAFRKLNEQSLAEICFLRSIEADMAYDQPYAHLMSLYAEQGKFELCDLVYSVGSKKAERKSYIMYHDGRVQYMKGNYQLSLLAGRCILIDEQWEDENAIVMVIKSLLAMIRTNQSKNPDEDFEEARRAWKNGMELFPDSEDIKALSPVFMES